MFMMMGIWMILPVLLIGVVVFNLVVRPQINQNEQAQKSSTPLDVLKARYASGEITREAYEQMRQDLEG
jgi:putative membrane protein